jgi:hypothetical protein
MKKIRVKIEEGLIREIKGIPQGYTVEILEYDVNRKDLPDLATDENRRICKISEWPAGKEAETTEETPSGIT